jgi:hypothetical protein
MFTISNLLNKTSTATSTTGLHSPFASPLSHQRIRYSRVPVAPWVVAIFARCAQPDDAVGFGGGKIGL